MDKEKREVIIQPRELFDVLQIMRTIRNYQARQDEVEDAAYIDKLITEVLDSLKNDEDKTAVLLNQEYRFGIWLCLDMYKSFTIDSGFTDEQKHVENIMAKFGGI